LGQIAGTFISLIVREFDALLPLRAGLAVADVAGSRARVKWPNDVWIDGRKVAGILVEARPQEGWAVLGLGVNVGTTDFPPDLERIATSLQLAGHAITVDDTLAALLAALRRWLPLPTSDVLPAWRERDALLGRTVRWENGGKEGVAAGIDPSGALLVDTAAGRVALSAGEVHLER